MDSQSLGGRIVRTFPKRFFERLPQRQKPLYDQSLALAFNETWTRPEAFSVLPSIRRALWESEVRKTAIECRLKPFDVNHEGDNSSCVTIKAESLVLTCHFVEGARQFVREAESRKQNAGVNRWLDYYTDSRLLTAPIPKIDKQPIYLNLLHGAYFPEIKSENLAIDESSCFLRIAIPANDSPRYLYNWSVQEFLQSYTTTLRAVTPDVSIEDKAQPKKKNLKLRKPAAGESE
jgi:hypothetical protein